MNTASGYTEDDVRHYSDTDRLSVLSAEPVTAREMAADRTLGRTALKYVSERQARREISGKTPRTYRDVLIHMARHIGWDTDVGRVTTRRIENWLRKGGGGDEMYRKRLSIARGFFAWCRKQKLMRADPTEGISAPRRARHVPRRISNEHAEMVATSVTDTRDRLIVILLFQQGLRRAELAGLEVGDLDLHGRLMRIVGKGGHSRVVPITDESMEAIEAYLAEHGHTSGPLIRSLRVPERGIGPDRIGDEWRRISRAAGVKATTHQTRHTTAGDMLDRGASLREVQGMLGHASIATVGVYSGWAEMNDLRRAMAGRRYGSRLGEQLGERLGESLGSADGLEDGVECVDAPGELVALRLKAEAWSHLVHNVVVGVDEHPSVDGDGSVHYVPAVAADENLVDLPNRRADHAGRK